MVHLLNKQCWNPIGYQNVVTTSRILSYAEATVQEIHTSPIEYNNLSL